jgi:xylulokinase
MLYNARKRCWSKKVCKLHGISVERLAQIVQCTEKIGTLTDEAATQLGLGNKCAVFAGGGDSSLIPLGAGCVKTGDTHVYIGTSGWVSTVVDKQITDPVSMIASVTGAIHQHYNYFAEMETSGKCIEWARDNLVVDNIGTTTKRGTTEPRYPPAYPQNTCKTENLLELMCEAAAKVPVGSNGVIFMPWLLGNRCPFEDANCRGGFFNVSLTTKKEDLIRSILEGILFHKRWMLECQQKKVQTSPVIRFVGGAARSKLICQMLADQLNRPVEQIEKPQNAGALGAAILMALGLGHIASLKEASSLTTIARTYTPNSESVALYAKNYTVFQRLYRKNKKNFTMLNRD